MGEGEVPRQQSSMDSANVLASDRKAVSNSLIEDLRAPFTNPIKDPLRPNNNLSHQKPTERSTILAVLSKNVAT